MKRYDPKKIEEKWQAYWQEQGLFATPDLPHDKKRYVLDMFPYPSGDGMHVGHPEGYTASDILSHYFRMRGFAVLHPMGWDAFGLPAENYAIKNKIHPMVSVEKNIARFRGQLKRLGFSYDWSREINTTDPDYYQWTQWIFLKLFHMGFAYEAEAPMNFCPSCKTGLADEEVVAGSCERCGAVVERREMRQWMLKITTYADRLLQDLARLEWPEKIKTMQRNWIGRSDGAEIIFRLIASASQNDAELTQKNAENLPRHSASRQRQSATLTYVKAFTTRPDTLFGATYVVLAPEHTFLKNLDSQRWGIANRAEVEAYIAQAIKKSELERLAEAEEKTGVQIQGIAAINPVNDEEIPVFVADYVLAHYGTGAIMAVPAHDARDFIFAKKFKLPIREVISPDGKPHRATKAYEQEGILVKSGEFNGLWNVDAKERIVTRLAKKGLAEKKIRYKLRDWIFSRQRYWGEPIPLVFCEACKKRAGESHGMSHPERSEGSRGSDSSVASLPQNDRGGDQDFSEGELLNPGWVAVPEEELPLRLPDVERYEPTGTGESPLAGISSWVNTTCPKCAGPARRETNTMPQWAGSCWYYLRFIDPKNSEALIDPEKERAWMPVDYYIGGAEHAVLHLLYARFWHKFLFDIGAVSKDEPFQRLFNQGLILGPDGQKMSKSRGNVINPDEVIEAYGADTFRLYEMFMGPLEDVKPWDTNGIVGMHRFLKRVWRFVTAQTNADRTQTNAEKLPRKSASSQRESADAMERMRHRVIKKVTEDIERFRFNTAISALMEYLNGLTAYGLQPTAEHKQTLLLLLAPFAPHITEELWREVLGNKESVLKQPWPSYDEGMLEEKEVRIVVQVNGRVRDTIVCPADVSEGEATAKAMESKNVERHLEGQEVKRVIFVQDKLLNIVTGE